MTAEFFRCPSRGGGVAASDEWRDGRDRWDSFPDGFAPWPRTCSFCGAVHPEDVLRLLYQGWTDTKTTKPHKGYLVPPGYAEWVAASTARIAEKGAEAFTERPDPDAPTPPVKFYAYHFSESQRAELNRLVGAS